MPDAFKVSIDDASLRKLQSELEGIKNGVPKALAGAINKASGKSYTRVKRTVRSILVLPNSEVEKAVKLSKTSERSDPIEAKIRFADEPRPLDVYPTRKLKKGYSVKVRRGKPPEKWKRAFFGKAKNSARDTMFTREKGRDKAGKLTSTGYARRLPVQKLRGPSLTAVFSETPGVVDKEMQGIGVDLPKELLSQVDRLLKRRKGS